MGSNTNRHRIQANRSSSIETFSHGNNHTVQFAAIQQLQVVLTSEKSPKFWFRTKSSSFISSPWNLTPKSQTAQFSPTAQDSLRSSHSILELVKPGPRFIFGTIRFLLILCRVNRGRAPWLPHPQTLQQQGEFTLNFNSHSGKLLWKILEIKEGKILLFSCWNSQVALLKLCKAVLPPLPAALLLYKQGNSFSLEAAQGHNQN